MSFRLKTILGIAIIETILLSVLVGYNISTLKQTQAKELEKRARTTIGLFSSTVREAVFATDIATLQALTDELHSLPEVSYVLIRESSHMILAQSGEVPAIDPKGENLSDGIFDIVRTIDVAGEIYATVRLGFDIASFENILAQATHRSLAIAGIEILLVGLFSLLLGDYLTRQLKGLRDGARHVADGELGYQIPVQGKDELAETAGAFNRMSMQVRKDHSMQRAIMDCALDMIICVDASGRIVEFNRASVSVLGYERDAVMGAELCDLIRPQRIRGAGEHDFRSFLTEDTALALGEKIESKVVTRHDETLPVEVVINKISDIGDGPYYIFYLADISDRKQAERLKNDFISTVSHELRTPLTSIHGAIALLNSGVLNERSDSANEQRALLTAAHTNSERLLQLVNDLLDIQKIESGFMRMTPEACDLNGLLETACQQNASYAHQYGVTIQHLPAPGPINVYVDRGRMLQVLANLVSNACKFSPRHGKVTLMVEVENGWVKTIVADQGKGIPETFKESIFSKFSQAETSSARRYAGTGLGLAITKQLIEANHGRIGFHSIENIGTEFYFYLPLLDAKRASGSGL